MDNLFRILHIASFQGNVGDNANHHGLRKNLIKVIKKDLQFTELEIRKFYQNYEGDDKQKFDLAFADFANSFDLVIIGGGNFFEIWIENSTTGTTIDISKEVIGLINKPLLFFGLGFDPYKGVPKGNINKFKIFLQSVFDKENIILSVRNDGSLKHLKNYYGNVFTKRIYKVPDGGFFISPSSINHYEIVSFKNNIAINIARDMQELRFPNNKSNNISYNQFIERFANTIIKLYKFDNKINFILVPHIYSDLIAISELIQLLPDKILRSSIKVAPYLNGDGSENYIFSLYKNSDLVLGMRFHTNVCSIGMGKVTIGLASYPKILDLYEEVGLLDRVVKINEIGFDEILFDKIKESFINKKALEIKTKKTVEKLKYDSEYFFNNSLIKILK